MAVSASFLILLALIILILPLQWVTAVILAAAFHEWCHIFAIRICGGKTGRLLIGQGGAKLQAHGLSRHQERICALAGPMGGILLLLFARWIPRTAICAGFQSLFNLLPVYPLDGGRVIRTLGLNERWCRIVENACLGGILVLGAWAAFGLHLGITPLAISVMVLFRAKRPCKAERFSIQ